MTPVDETLAQVASRYDDGDGEGAALALAARRRLDWRKRHGGKECAVCHETKKVSDFGQDATRPDGLEPRCRVCRRR